MSPAPKSSLNPNLPGEWKLQNSNEFIRILSNEHSPDGFLLEGRLNVPVELQQNGQILHTNHPPSESFHHRISGNAESFVGTWALLDEENNDVLEEYHLREDGRYLSLWKDDPIAYTGFYRIHNNHMSSCELIYQITQNGNTLQLSGLEKPADTVTYHFENDKLHWNSALGGLKIFERIPEKIRK